MSRYPAGISILIVSLALVAMVGCEKEGPAEKAGKQFDKAVEKLKEATE